MLKELNQYENLGTPKFFYEFFTQLALPDAKWTKASVSQYFYNRSIDNLLVFDGCVPLAEEIGAIFINGDGTINLNPKLQPSLVSERYLSNKLLEMILVRVKNDETFHSIFCSEYISYDFIYKLIQIENSAFQFKYSNFRQLLINFNFILFHPDKNIRKFIVNSKYRQMFDQELKPEITKRKVGIDELEKILEQKQINGREAETFVLEFEKKRLIKHPNQSGIEIISDYDVGAGYDITSYENECSTECDRFIEVKSFSGIPSFHWSNNEINIARLKKSEYFLYLVNRDKMKEDGYEPFMIQNPYTEIMEENLESLWDKKVEGYFIVKK